MTDRFCIDCTGRGSNGCFYFVAHILIAEKVLEDIKIPVDYSTYIVGAIAPDAVHASPDYTRIMKEKVIYLQKGLFGEKWRKKASFMTGLKVLGRFMLVIVTSIIGISF